MKINDVPQVTEKCVRSEIIPEKHDENTQSKCMWPGYNRYPQYHFIKDQCCGLKKYSIGCQEEKSI